MANSNEQKADKTIKPDVKLSAEEELAAGLVDFVKQKFEELDYPRFFSTFKLPERRGLAVTGNKSLERLTSNIITKYIREEPYVQMEQPSYFVDGKEVKNAQTQLDLFVAGMLDVGFRPEEYGFTSTLPMGAVHEEIPIIDPKTKKIMKTKQTQTATQAYLDNFISDL
uniref:SAM-dependent DNA methyltransferase n=1 Tax=Meloidogyne hapla TaxID=6305 RepID=A0A1I8BG94_MELHA